MPHIVVEHTNLPVNFRQLLLAINNALAKNHPGVFPVPGAIKSRAINVGDDYAIGIEGGENSICDESVQDSLKFIHTNIRILEGYTETQRCAITTTAKAVIEAFLKDHLNYEGEQVQVTVEIGEIYKAGFQKVVLE